MAREWLQADGAGGFASGTETGERTRRYHALLLHAAIPRQVLVNGLEAWVDGTPISTQRYTPDVIYPQIVSQFTATPWPSWAFTLPDGTRITHDIIVQPQSGATLLYWTGRGKLGVRLLLSGRDYHSLHHENPAFRFDATISGGGNVSWQPYPNTPAIAALTNGTYTNAPQWYRNFLYTDERDRGLDCTEDLASPGLFDFDLGAGPAIIVLRTGNELDGDATAIARMMRAAEQARRTADPIALAARAYRATFPRGETLIAGYPWFTDWGRDTFIALRGLLLGLGDLQGAEAILRTWAACVSDGMLPNRFPDQGEAPEYNAVDASLWFIVAVHELLEACAKVGQTCASEADLRAACSAILQGYKQGTRFGIAMDTDGLLRAGVPGVQLTWMDAKCGKHVITPRIGKPVEIQALWINALRIGGQDWRRAQAAFEARFVNPAGGLFDVIDVDHVAGTADASIRPNQIFACGGLPFRILEGSAANSVVQQVEAELLTPLGLRTLSPHDPAYIAHYRGGPEQRDAAYHQGTAWPWLLAAFVDAWLATGGTRAEAAARFLPPLEAHLTEAGLGHISEITDGDAPFTPGGCPFQAWSLGEYIRIRNMLAS